MELPLTSAPQTFWINGNRDALLFNTGAYATTATSSTLQVASVLNRAGKQNAVTQTTSANQPTWSSNALVGTHLVDMGWGATIASGATVAGSPTLIFGGSPQCLEYDSLASLYSNDAPVTVVAVVSNITAGGKICEFGVSTSTHYLALEAASTTSLIFSELNATSTYTASATITAASTHVVTGVRSGGFVTIRVDGAQIATTSIATAGTDVYDRFCIGAGNANGSIASYLTGQISELAVYSGAADILSVETYLLQKYGIIRGATVTTNSGF
jgi:hypothetical protein